MSEKKSMVESLRDIRQGFLDKLRNHEALEEVKEINYGRKADLNKLRTPTIWILPSGHTPNLQGMKTEEHDFTFTFLILVKSNKPEEGYEKAQDLSMMVYDALTEDRTLGGAVHDVRPVNVDPAYSGGADNPQLYWSAVDMAFRLKRR